MTNPADDWEAGVRRVLCAYGALPLAELRGDMYLLKDLRIPAGDLSDMAAELERLAGVDVRWREWRRVNTVDDVMALLTRYRREESA